MDVCVRVRVRVCESTCVGACGVLACMCVRLSFELIYKLVEVLDEHVHPLNVVGPQ